MSSPYITPGQLNVRINIKKEVKTVTTTGERIATTEELSSCWAKREDVSGSEDIDGKVMVTNIRKYYIRYQDYIRVIATQLFVLDGSSEYNITAVAEIGNKNYLELKCIQRE